mgnify:CR=1 FL=1
MVSATDVTSWRDHHVCYIYDRPDIKMAVYVAVVLKSWSDTGYLENYIITRTDSESLICQDTEF